MSVAERELFQQERRVEVRRTGRSFSDEDEDKGVKETDRIG